MTNETLLTQSTENTSEVEENASAVTGESGAADQANASATGAEGKAEETNAEESGSESDGEKPEGAPEKYEFKPVEGAEVGEMIIEEFSAVAKELNLSQDNAQLVLDRMAPVYQKQQAAQMENLRASWIDQVKTDSEFGGDKLGENLAIAKKGLEAFDTDGKVSGLLQATGLGDNPDIIRLMIKVGKAVSEDTFISGKPAGGAKSHGERLYDKSNHNTR